jgi:hypothetical protein
MAVSVTSQYFDAMFFSNYYSKFVNNIIIIIIIAILLIAPDQNMVIFSFMHSLHLKNNSFELVRAMLV